MVSECMRVLLGLPVELFDLVVCVDLYIHMIRARACALFVDCEYIAPERVA